ncbi:hypothetical protein ACGFYD_41175, partial [Streptomyces sp. NPDC048508]
SRSRSDSATTGLGKRGYQSLGALLLVMIRDRPVGNIAAHPRTFMLLGLAYPLRTVAEYLQEGLFSP